MSGATVIISPAGYSVSPTFDFYISPTGSDSNPGTLASPWAITALMSKTSTIAGKTVGLLDGTYDVPNGYDDNWGGSLQHHGQRITAAGTSGARTVIQSVNPRGATLQPAAGVTFSIITLDAAYVTLKDIIFNAGSIVTSIRFWGDYGTIEGCQFEAAQANTNDNAGHIYFKAHDAPKVQYPTFRNCHFKGLANLSGANPNNRTVNANHIHGFAVYGALIEGCTFRDSYAPLRPKYDWAAYTFRNNLVYDCQQGLVHICTDQSSVAIRNTVNNNLFIGTSVSTPCSMGDYLYATGQRAALVDYFNNTSVCVYLSDGSDQRWWRSAGETPNSGGTSKFYNNIFHYAGTPSGTHVTFTFGGEAGAGVSDLFSLMNYNGYPSGWFKVNQGDFYTPDASYSTLAAWNAASGFEAGSVQATPSFSVGTGTTPSNYTLQSGSAFKGAGKSDGTIGGSAVDMGCWGGVSVPTHIGATF